MRKREYESKLNAWKREIEKERKQLYKMEDELYWTRSNTPEYYLYYHELENKVFEKRERIEWMIKMILIIENYKLAPKARKSDTLYNFKSNGK